MHYTSELINIVIEKKFVELLCARKKNTLYDFKTEVKKELETSLATTNNPVQKKELENFLHEFKGKKFKNEFLN